MLDESYQNLIKPCKVAWELSETAAEPPHTAKPMTIKFDFFSGLVSFSFFFLLLPPAPVFLHFYFLARRPRSAKWSKRRGKRKKRKIAKPTKVKHFGTFFCARKRRKALEVVDAAVWRWGRKKSKLWGWRSDAKGPSIPPQPGKEVGGLSPRNSLSPPSRGSSSLWGGARSPTLPAPHNFLPSTGLAPFPFTSCSYYSCYLLPPSLTPGSSWGSLPFVWAVSRLSFGAWFGGAVPGLQECVERPNRVLSQKGNGRVTYCACLREVFSD